MKAIQVRSKIWLEVDGAPPTGAFLSESLGATDSRCWPHRLLRAIERHGSINAAATFEWLCARRCADSPGTLRYTMKLVPAFWQNRYEATASTRRFSGVGWNGMAAAISNIKMAALIGM